MKPLLFALAAAGLVMTGCSSTPAPRFHSLLSTSPTASTREAVPALPLDLAPVTVPAAVEQPQWVVRLPDDTLRVLEQEQWVAPLREDLRAALFERLAQRFGAVDVRTSPSPNAVRVKVDVLRFESIAGKEVWLDSAWTALTDVTRAAPLVCRSSVHEPVTGDVTALAAAHRRAVVRLADEIGVQLLALYNAAEVRCP